jgi:hypothetical protein
MLRNAALRIVDLLRFNLSVQQAQKLCVITLVDSSPEQASAYSELQVMYATKTAGSGALNLNYLKQHIKKHNRRNYQSTLRNISEERISHNFLLSNMETQCEWDLIAIV